MLRNRLLGLSCLLLACASDSGDTSEDGSGTGTGTTTSPTSTSTAGTSPTSTSTAGTSTAGTSTAGTSTAGTDTAGTDTVQPTTTNVSGSDDTGTCAAVSGTISRSVSGSGDHIGTIYAGLYADCNEVGSVSPEFGLNFPDSDLSDISSEIPFSFDNVAAGSYFLTAFLDDNGSGSTPDTGELRHGGCIAITVACGEDQADIALVLDTVI